MSKIEGGEENVAHGTHQVALFFTASSEMDADHSHCSKDGKYALINDGTKTISALIPAQDISVEPDNLFFDGDFSCIFPSTSSGNRFACWSVNAIGAGSIIPWNNATSYSGATWASAIIGHKMASATGVKITTGATGAGSSLKQTIPVYRLRKTGNNDVSFKINYNASQSSCCRIGIIFNVATGYSSLTPTAEVFGAYNRGLSGYISITGVAIPANCVDAIITFYATSNNSEIYLWGASGIPGSLLISTRNIYKNIMGFGLPNVLQKIWEKQAINVIASGDSITEVGLWRLSALEATVRNIRSVNPDADFIFMVPCPRPVTGLLPDADEFDDAIWTKQHETMAKKYGGNVVYTDVVFNMLSNCEYLPDQYLWQDGLHPNTVGLQLIGHILRDFFMSSISAMAPDFKPDITNVRRIAPLTADFENAHRWRSGSPFTHNDFLTLNSSTFSANGIIIDGVTEFYGMLGSNSGDYLEFTDYFYHYLYIYSLVRDTGGALNIYIDNVMMYTISCADPLI